MRRRMHIRQIHLEANVWCARSAWNIVTFLWKKKRGKKKTKMQSYRRVESSLNCFPNTFLSLCSNMRRPQFSHRPDTLTQLVVRFTHFIWFRNLRIPRTWNQLILMGHGDSNENQCRNCNEIINADVHILVCVCFNWSSNALVCHPAHISNM